MACAGLTSISFCYKVWAVGCGALLAKCDTRAERAHVMCMAGFGAAKHLSEQGYDVTLLDASPNPGGLSAGWRTPQGRAVEAGVKGMPPDKGFLPLLSLLWSSPSTLPSGPALQRPPSAVLALCLTFCRPSPAVQASGTNTTTSSRSSRRWASPGR